MTAVETARRRFKNPPKTFEEYMEILVKQELPKSVAIFESCIQKRVNKSCDRLFIVVHAPRQK